MSAINKVLKTDVAVVGAGPVGLVASLLLEKFGFDFMTFERNTSLRSHPSAHWINLRSKEIFAEIPGLVRAVENQQEDWKHFSHYLYVQRILGRVLGRDNHFAPSIQAKLESFKQYTTAQPSHVNQSLLCSTLFANLQNKEAVRFGTQITKILSNSPEKAVLETQDGTQIQAKRVIACDGFHSVLRKQLGVRMQGESELLSFINVHFQSPTLARMITAQNQDAMLHFIYNQDFPAVLVNHTKNTGVFVLQVPNYEPFYDILEHSTPEQLIKTVISGTQASKVTDIKIIHCGRWKLASQIAETYFPHGSILLAGDAAHSFPPAGGFGMNTGIQDAHNLIHKLQILKKNPKLRTQSILKKYSDERREVGSTFMNIANKGFERSLEISKDLGLDPSYLKLAQKLSFLPMRHLLYPLGVKFLFRPKPINKHISLFFEEEFKCPRLSKHRFQICDGNWKEGSYYLAEGCQKSEFRELDSVQDSQIVRFNSQSDEKLVRRDGILLH